MKALFMSLNRHKKITDQNPVEVTSSVWLPAHALHSVTASCLQRNCWNTETVKWLGYLHVPTSFDQSLLNVKKNI